MNPFKAGESFMVTKDAKCQLLRESTSSVFVPANAGPTRLEIRNKRKCVESRRRGSKLVGLEIMLRNGINITVFLSWV